MGGERVREGDTHLLETIDLSPDRAPAAALEADAALVGVVGELVAHVGGLVVQVVELVVRVGELTAQVVALVEGGIELLAQFLRQRGTRVRRQ